MSAPTLHRWFAEHFRPVSRYTAPEQTGIRLVGDIHGHPSERWKDGHTVQTSAVVSATGRVVTTSSGSQYRLGRIDPGYRRWMRKQGMSYDPKQPIKVGS